MDASAPFTFMASGQPFTFMASGQPCSFLKKKKTGEKTCLVWSFGGPQWVDSAPELGLSPVFNPTGREVVVPKAMAGQALGRAL